MKRKLILCGGMIAGLAICSISASAQENVAANQDDTIKAEQITDKNPVADRENIEKKTIPKGRKCLFRKDNDSCDEADKKEQHVRKTGEKCNREGKGYEVSKEAREKGKEMRERRREKIQESEDKSFDKEFKHGEKYGHQKQNKEHENVKGNHGHGNNADHIDCSNPGKAPFSDKDSEPSLDDEKKPEKAKAEKSEEQKADKPWWKFW